MSSPGSPPDGDTSTRSVASTANKVAFLVHSVHTLTENLPPEVDDKSLARQRRRRTSPEDQKILEDAFAQDPRPGKAARKDIVSRVSLGDKEVQIWFQNRRQNTRRKLRLEGIEVPPSSDVVAQKTTSSSPEVASAPPPVQASSSQPQVLGPASSNFADLPPSTATASSDAVENTGASQDSQQSTAAAREPTPAVESANPQSTQMTSSQEVQVPASSQQSSKSGYIANRRVTTACVDDIVVVPQARKPLRRFASSHDFRLSMTDDGKAKVVDRANKSPSPEKPRVSAVENAIVSRLGSLRRSHSAAGLDAINSASQPAPQQNVRKLARTSTLGRSRDSRTWEFWCDSDARSQLQARAAQESSGSAAEAIGLIRSTSSRALQVNTAKMNSPNPGHHRGRETGKHGRPPLQRAKTHVGFIKSKSYSTTNKQKQHSQNKDLDEDFEHLNSESDKENNEPMPMPQFAPLGKARGAKKVLGDNMQIMSHASSLGSMMAREAKSRSARGPKSVEIHVDQEISAFMGQSESHSTAGDELDCVQSLLSLSQGNWAR